MNELFPERKEEFKIFNNQCLEFYKNVYLIIPFEGICFISERPIEIHKTKGLNERFVLHKEGSPALVFKDTYSYHCLNGVRVPKWLAETKAEDIDPKLILKEENVEIKREGVRKVGAQKMIEKLGAKVIDSKEYAVGGKYDLLSVDWTGSNRIYLKMNNPSIDAIHIEPVHPSCETVDMALGFRNSDFYNNQWQNKEFKYEQPNLLT